MSELRWRLADEEVDGQTTLFGADGLTGPQRGTGTMTDLEFLPVLARKVINAVPKSSQMPFRWTINVYRVCSHACRFCFARPTHEYLGLGIGEDFDSKIVVKVNAIERARAEVRSPKWGGDHIAMGTNTDPYQKAEGKYHLTRGIIEVLGRAANPFSSAAISFAKYVRIMPAPARLIAMSDSCRVRAKSNATFNRL